MNVQLKKGYSHEKIIFLITSLHLPVGRLLGGGVATEAPATKEAVATEAPVVAEEATATVTATAEPSREAALSDFENEVMARIQATDEFKAAILGMKILAGGGVETGVDGRARIDLLPEGTIIRVGPNSSFTLPVVTEENGQPKTTLELLFGKVYILLNGGTLEVTTPTGVASVRGSLMRVEYDPETKRIKASCLEGHCSLKNKKGEQVDLVEGEYTYIEGNFPPFDPMLIDSSEIEEWLADVPELGEFLGENPDPDDYPDNENDNGNDNTNDNNNDDEEEEEENENNDNGYPNP